MGFPRAFVVFEIDLLISFVNFTLNQLLDMSHEAFGMKSLAISAATLRAMPKEKRHCWVSRICQHFTLLGHVWCTV